MEKKEIVKKFLKEGRQLDLPALEYFTKNPEKTDEFIQMLRKASGAKKTTITLDLIKSMEKKESEVKILKKFFIKHENEKISISDYSNRLIENYETKKQMLINRVDTAKLISINKIQKQKEFVLICTVREKDTGERSVVVEDLTGKTTVFFVDRDELENLFEDDVVAILCEGSAEGIKAKQVIWPDVPLKRSVNKSKEKVYCLFISDFHMDSEQFSKERYEKFVDWAKSIDKESKFMRICFFILGGVSQKRRDVERLLDALPKNSFKIFLRSKEDAVVDDRDDVLLSDLPLMVEIEGIRLLLCQGRDLCEDKEILKENVTDMMINVLKRRDLRPLGKKDEQLMPLKSTLIDKIPDIFASGGVHIPEAVNYKGISIITTGSFIRNLVFWSVDLSTREINKLDFS